MNCFSSSIRIRSNYVLQAPRWTQLLGFFSESGENLEKSLMFEQTLSLFSHENLSHVYCTGFLSLLNSAKVEYAKSYVKE